LLTSIADICLDIAGRCVVALYDNHRNIHSVARLSHRGNVHQLKVDVQISVWIH